MKSPRLALDVAKTLLVEGDLAALQEAGLRIVWAEEPNESALTVIDQVVAAHFCIEPEMLLSRCRVAILSQARSVCYLLAKEMTSLSWVSIAAHYGRSPDVPQRVVQGSKYRILYKRTATALAQQVAAKLKESSC